MRHKHEYNTMPILFPSTTLRRSWLIITALFLCFTLPFLFFHSDSFYRVHGWLTSSVEKLTGNTPPTPILPPPPPEIPGFYHWDTKSSFNPVRQHNIASKSIQDLCASWPAHLLSDIQPVLKTGHGVLDARVGPQLHSVSACLVNLLIFSDTEEHYQGHQTFDVIADIPPYLRDYEPDLKPWRDGHLADGTAERKQAWKADRFKFFTGVSRAWRMRPDRKWYVFYEADTYIVWDNVFRMLEHFDPDEAHYFGSPSPGRRGMWFANGGPGYILSREAMRRLVKEDYDEVTGAYVGSKLIERYWKDITGDCCGDSMLGWALALNNVTLSGMYPMFTPHAPHGVPFSGPEPHWCQPVLTMHRPSDDDILGLWRWQWEHREVDRPLLYRDLATTYFKLPHQVAARWDWNTARKDSFLAPAPPPDTPPSPDSEPHASPSACAAACVVHEDCVTWTLHLRTCHLTRTIRYGQRAEPGLESAKKKGSPAGPVREDGEEWTEEELRFVSGWDAPKIAAWVDEWPCDEVQWLRPSWKRVF